MLETCNQQQRLAAVVLWVLQSDRVSPARLRRADTVIIINISCNNHLPTRAVIDRHPSELVRQVEELWLRCIWLPPVRVMDD